MKDPLNRPIAEHLITETSAAGDLILATFTQRFAAFCIDALIIIALFCAIIAAQSKPTAQSLCLIFYLTWGGYVVAFSASKKSATIGQALLSIHLYSLFSGGIKYSTAIIRFILISYPCAIAMFAAGDLICATLLPNIVAPSASVNNDENLSYTLLVVAGLLQIWLLMPLLSRKYRNVSWDKTLRCCVIKQRL